MFQQLFPALRFMLLLTVVTGLIYPGAVTAICQVLLKNQANGSLLTRNGQVIGSRLLGQNFARPEYFHPRPSAAGNDGYDASASSCSNLAPTSRKLYDRVKAAADSFRRDNPDYLGPIPADALTASGSGLDPEISIGNARAQMSRVAKARAADPAAVEKVVASFSRDHDLGFLGEPRVNVLELNLALDSDFPHK